MRTLFGAAANYYVGYRNGESSGFLGTILGWALFIGGGYLLVEHWDSIMSWMHSLSIVQGLEGMSNGFIFVCVVITGFILLALLPVFGVVAVVAWILFDILTSTIAWLILTTFKLIPDVNKGNESEEIN